ncbi:MAG: glycosyltransferase family 1 protein [Calditrichaeota bacterium]|nr:MAG: glycosyltransferase family 1 protein [Calditrichota bacterium]
MMDKFETTLLYLSNERFPANLACTIQQIRMCEAFGRLGVAVQLVHPAYFDVPSYTEQEIRQFYGVEPLFSIKRLFSLLSLSKPLVDGRKRLKLPFIGGLSFLLSSYLFALRILRKCSASHQIIVYSRNVNGAYAFLQLVKWWFRHKKVKIIFEVHALEQQTPRSAFKRLLRDSDGLVVISKALFQALIERFPVNPQKILIAHDGVSARAFAFSELTKKDARDRLRLSSAPTVIYTGQLLPGKGAQLFVQASKLTAPQVQFILVGGHGQYLQRLREMIKKEKLTNILLPGFVPPADVPLYLAAADVLVLPPTADHEISQYTSPLKLFEYMASCRPIVAGDLPVLSEILQDHHNALFFQNGNANDLAQKIALLLADEPLSHRLASQAFQDVRDFTWESRAEKIYSFIQSIDQPLEVL